MQTIDSFDITPNGMVDVRLVEIDGRWYVYKMNLSTAQVVNENEFAKNSAAGIRYLFGDGMTEEQARQQFEQEKRRYNANTYSPTPPPTQSPGAVLAGAQTTNTGDSNEQVQQSV